MTLTNHYESNNLPAHSLNHTHILHPMWKDAKLRIVAHKLVSSSNTLPVPVNTLYFTSIIVGTSRHSETCRGSHEVATLSH